MNADEALQIVESQVLYRSLSPIERLIFCQSWEGKGYIEMARGSGYNSNYFKEVGSKLWHNLSEIMGMKVSKKNLQIVFKDYQPNYIANSNELEDSPTYEQIAVEESSENDFYKAQNNNDALNQASSLYNQISLNYIKFPSGPVPLNSPLYIKRPPVEELAIREVYRTHLGSSSQLSSLIPIWVS
ncbi:MAG: AAA-like domain-containing protein [Rivularia sp. ALOHA_DT_140]|nr:AAA-like domain-containing protein [Rivularia sp. ALOHA_DT_140]